MRLFVFKELLSDNMMNISYRFSSPQGDVEVDDGMLEKKFAVGPLETHPFLTLRDFFDTLQRFLLRENGSGLQDILSRLWGRVVRVEEIETMVIRYEKYGTLYQICSLDVSAAGTVVKMCVNVAFSAFAQQTLQREFELLAFLGNEGGYGYLPQSYKLGWIDAGQSGKTESWLLALLEWFDGYEEWHFKPYEDSTRAFLWDMGGGHRFLSAEQTFEIIVKASEILTHYFDVESTRRITTWHHGAGDFIVRTSESGVDLKLITARGYEPIRSSAEETILESLCTFCLETLTKMRLDKWEGLGESTWADPFVLKATLKGFFEALRGKEARSEMKGLPVADILQTLKSLEVRQIRALVKKQFIDDKDCDSSDYLVVSRHLDDHALEIHEAIQSFFG
jgi:hypothetical protein